MCQVKLHIKHALCPSSLPWKQLWWSSVAASRWAAQRGPTAERRRWPAARSRSLLYGGNEPPLTAERSKWWWGTLEGKCRKEKLTKVLLCVCCVTAQTVAQDENQCKKEKPMKLMKEDLQIMMVTMLTFLEVRWVGWDGGLITPITEKGSGLWMNLESSLYLLFKQQTCWCEIFLRFCI